MNLRKYYYITNIVLQKIDDLSVFHIIQAFFSEKSKIILVLLKNSINHDENYMMTSILMTGSGKLTIQGV